ncbi:glycine cleavage system aminomethyltransferase GcvT, partial [Candidatus Fermentibacterales bacterium]|nr:glycine cleavage system aminomethyltransferase GcvT [Candidatus Fermentibacterales bacterium]
DAHEVETSNESDDTGLIAIQGPNAQAVVQKLTDVDLEPIGFYHHTRGTVLGKDALIARTGYTGEDGFELYLAPADCPEVWYAAMEAGKPFGMIPVGLGARDTLRLEMGYALYGNDIDHTTTPMEARLGWVVKLATDKDFISREILLRQKEEGVSSQLSGFLVEGRGFARHGDSLYSGDRKVGSVTSGTLGPSVGTGVGMAYVETGFHKKDTVLEAEVRHGKRLPVRIVRTPFYKEGSRR